MIKFILTFFSILPLRLNHFIGSLIGQYLYLSNSDSKLVVSKNIQTCFHDLSETEQLTLIKKSLIETGKGLSESGFIWFNSFKNNLYIHPKRLSENIFYIFIYTRIKGGFISFRHLP